MNRKQIGWYNLKEETVFCDRGFECAAWYENIRVSAGKYPAVVYDYRVRDDEHIDGHCTCSVHALMDGVVVSDDFGSRFCGMPIGGYDSTQNAGKPSHYSLRDYGYSVAKSVIEDANSPWELLPEYEARRIDFEDNGKQYHTWGIFLKG